MENDEKKNYFFLNNTKNFNFVAGGLCRIKIDSQEEEEKHGISISFTISLL